MPWTATDADSHKKGLTDIEKKKWAAIANAILKSCREGGRKDCEGIAIATASARVGRKK